MKNRPIFERVSGARVFQQPVKGPVHIQIDTMIDTLDGMMGEPALSAESPSFDTALDWYLARLYDLAKTFRDI
ncbi:hypothetical protein DLJ49_18110 [Rhodovulum sp. 12E13]|nr:hypothetical protein DLJ49_18110 [Rhodovulum sp. 12E13]